MWQKLRFNMGYMIWQVAIKGAISAPFWIVGCMWVEEYADGPVTASDVMAILYIFLITFVFAVAFGAIIGAGIGAILGVAYTFINGVMGLFFSGKRIDRPLLVSLSAAAGMALFIRLFDNAYADPSIVSGGILAGLGAAVSTFTYLDSYQRQFGRHHIAGRKRRI